ncbi:HDOD domain-containing protein [Pseudomonas sp. UBA6310]|uniref:HDOD domain-containing protein n=1 Tax=Pseudomonas sp. UBA6310 TaxID=1947327 RepID=UPI00257B2FB9|nr:HDOD domain-containing protein [Pseudomonas sp. UBA6310]
MQSQPHADARNLRLALLDRFLRGEARVPQMPENAEAIRRLLEDSRTQLEQLSRVINGDPALAAYLMQFAENPLFKTGRPCQHLRDVLGRLGIRNLNNLVLAFSLRNLFTSTEPTLQRVFRNRWKNAQLRAAYSAALCGRCPGIAVEDALLAGLLQDIGSLPLLDEIGRWPDAPRDEDELHALCDAISGPIGVILLTSWNQVPAIVDVTRHRDDWQREHAGKADLADLVQVASLLQQPRDEAPLAQLPALRRLFPDADHAALAQQLGDEVPGEAAFWLKLLGGKAN